MPSARLVLAAQINGAKSRGPKTTEGKQRSAANSRRHGLYSARITPDAEAITEFQELLPTLMEQYKPATPSETRIIESLAQAIAGIHWTWRETRAVFDRDLLDQPGPSELTQTRIFDAFARHASLLERIETLERRFTRQWRSAVVLLANRPEELRQTQKSGERTGSCALPGPAASRYTTLGPELPPSALRIFFGERTEYDSNSKFHYWSDP